MVYMIRKSKNNLNLLNRDIMRQGQIQWNYFPGGYENNITYNI